MSTMSGYFHRLLDIRGNESILRIGNESILRIRWGDTISIALRIVVMVAGATANISIALRIIVMVAGGGSGSATFATNHTVSPWIVVIVRTSGPFLTGNIFCLTFSPRMPSARCLTMPLSYS